MSATLPIELDRASSEPLYRQIESFVRGAIDAGRLRPGQRLPSVRGLAVRKVLAREHAPLGDLLLVTDDFALPFGKLRFREGGGPGGHNGLRSVIGELGTEKFSRLRVGIGSPERGFRDHVLNTFQPDERQRLDELLDAAADAVEEWARHGTSKAANRFNMFELRPADEARLAAPGEVDGPPDAEGIRRTRTGWRRVLPRRDES